MDVTTQNWPAQLGPMLEAISNATFVSLDFEFTGISMKPTTGPPYLRSPKQTLQQRYEESKSAAEKFQIIQVGLTIVEEDVENKQYLMKPYNIHVSPLVTESIEIDRVFSLQSSSIAFLLKHGFDLQKPFTTGIEYLSRTEETIARRVEDSKDYTQASSFGTILTRDPEQLRFIREIRLKVEDWIGHDKISGPLAIKADEYVSRGAGFNPDQRRLIAQLVRFDFPTLRCATFPSNIQISGQFEVHTELTRAKALFAERLQRQVGLRHLFEGLVTNGHFRALDITKTIPLRWDSDAQLITRRFEETKIKLRKPTVLVGHNIFVDLINFYACFIGKLPPTVEEFQRVIHDLFPLVIDTKYLATHLNNGSRSRSSLHDLHNELKSQASPTITCEFPDSKYEGENISSHEAGYDSYATAQIAVRLSAKLESIGRYYVDSSSVQKRSGSDLEAPDAKREKKPSEELADLFGINGVITPTPSPPPPPTTVLDLKVTGRSAAVGKFVEISPHLDEILARPILSPFMPHFGSDFWKIYGNRLRVNGTVEGLCQLGAGNR